MTSLLNIAGNIPVSAAAAEEGQSLRFEDGDNAYLNWTPSTNGSSLTQTLSFWMKRTSEGNYIFRASEFYLYLSGDNLNYYDWRQGANGLILQTSAVYRDVSAWMHVVLTQDRGNATASNRIKLYVNGEQVTSFSTATYPNQNEGSYFNNSGNTHYISHPSTNQYDGYLANVTFIDGQALDPTSFGEYEDTLWKPKSDTDIQALTFGTNGFYLPFKQTTEAEGFSTVTYSGSGADQSIEGVGFEPDFVWIKNRTFGTANNSYSHTLFDSVRGVGRYLNSNETSDESAFSASFSLTSFDDNGFSISDGGTLTNASGSNYVAWCWDAGSGSAVSNTDGSITSSVKANTAKGFSIVSWTGDGTAKTVGHGLDTPEIIFLKNRSDSEAWEVMYDNTDPTKSIVLNGTGDGRVSNYFSSVSSTTFGVGPYNRSNGNGDGMIAYCFHSVSGYSDIGSYTGDGTSNGSKSINLGFKPAFVMIKRTNDTENWMMLDTTRNPSGIINNNLYANLSNAESDYDRIEATSTGFDIYSNFNDINASGSTYIYMAFADTRDATFFGDTSGNGNNWTPNALNNTDVVPDSPVSGGNFAVLNPLDKVGVSLSEGNLKTTATAASFQAVRSTITYPSGSWYAEVRSDAGIGNGNSMVGITRVSDALSTMTGSNIVGTSSTAWGYASNGNIYNSNAVNTATGTTWSVGDIIGVAFDGSSVKFYKNNSLIHTESSLTGDYVLSLGQYSTDAMTANFGADSSFSGNETPQGNTDDNGVGDFYYAPPSGFLALTTGNLPAPAITAPDEYFNTVLYSGNNTQLSVTGVNFQPDWTWIKKRNNIASHVLQDSVRGSFRYLVSSLTNSENTDSANDWFRSFDSDGFTVSNTNTGGTPTTEWNNSGDSYVAWNWLAGGTAVSNTDGSITSQVSANTDAGFSIVTFTSPATSSTAFTVGHGLSSAPEMIITKERDGTLGWLVYHDELPSPKDNYLLLNSTAGNSGTITDCWGTSAPTSSVFGMKTTVSINTSKSTIAYCFHSVEGYSKIGSYTGNGSSDGVYVHLGFRPSWIMVKRTDDTGSWYILDNKRNGFNPDNIELSAESSAVEADFDRLDFTSNGFKMRQMFTGTNASGGSYIFLAFAEAPFKSANAR